MLKSNRMKLPATFLFILLISTGFAQRPKPDFTKAKAIITDHVENRKFPSISVAVVKGGKIIWEESFGYADRENKRKATPNTPYYTASISKTLTATALMKMAEQKLISIDSPVNKYLKNWKVTSYRWDVNKATVKSVMSHTSGLTTFNFWCRSGDSLSCANMDDEIMRRYAVILSPPGHFDYSNIGYGVLDHVIRDVSGMKYAEFMHREVFEPLGMKNTFVSANPMPADRAIRYVGDAAFTLAEYPPSHSFSAGASDVYSSVHDLALFAMLHLDDLKKKSLISTPSIRAMQDTVARNGSNHYGLAWWIDRNYNGYKGVLAQGGTWNSQAWLELIPSEDIAVILLGNNGNGSPYRAVINEVLAELLPTFKTNLIAAANAPRKEGKSRDTPEVPVSSRWSGVVKTYKGDIPVAFNFDGLTSSTADFRDNKNIALPKVNIGDNFFSYSIDGDLELDDMGPGPYGMNFYLWRERDELFGSLQTRGSGPALSFWVEMKKAD